MYKSFVRSNLEYAEVVWDGCLKRESDLIESVQFDAARLITGYMKGTHRESLLIYTGLHMRTFSFLCVAENCLCIKNRK